MRSSLTFRERLFTMEVHRIVRWEDDSVAETEFVGLVSCMPGQAPLKPKPSAVLVPRG